MKHPASHVLRHWLVVKGHINLPVGTPPPEWSSFLSSMADAPDNAAALYDTPGLKDGRLHKTGENIIHHGVQIKIRSATYIKGWRKIYDIAQAFETLKNEQLLLEDTNYKIQAVSQAGTILALGVEEGTKRRDLFTLNVIVTLSVTQ